MNASSLSFQDIILRLQQYWGEQGCVIMQPYDSEVGAGTFHTATTLRSLGPAEWRTCYAQPCRRPADGRYGENPNRMQHYYQFQVVIKPSPDNIQELYLGSLKELGMDPTIHDIRFVEDNWENPTLGAWGLGWEVWLNGMEVTQFTYFQQVGGLECKPVTGEITYGLERLAMVSQNVNSLFDVDTVMHITNKVSEITGAHYGESNARDVSLRIITDHIRSASFMICDGVLPSNEGRGYVLRRLLRRAARHGKLLGVNRPFLYEIVDTVVAVNECEYKDLREKQSYITKVIRTEEENFAKTIDGGMKIFTELLNAHKEKGETVFSGADAFKLYDTYGFPIDLTV